MSTIVDHLHTTDNIMVEIQPGTVYECPQCGKASKQDHQPEMLICSNRGCRFKFAKADVTPRSVSGFEAPAFPCPNCGKESKEHHGVNERICSSRDCRHIF